MLLKEFPYESVKTDVCPYVIGDNLYKVVKYCSFRTILV